MSMAVSWGYGSLPRELRSRVLFEEEEVESAGDVGSWSQEPVEDTDEALFSLLTPVERNVLRGFDDRARRSSKRARAAHRTYLVLSSASVISAASVPVAIAMAAPPWVAAALGAAAAIAQSILQILKSEQTAFELHAMLLRLSARRDVMRSELRRAKTRPVRSEIVTVYELEASWLMAEAGRAIAKVDAPGALGSGTSRVPEDQEGK